MHRALIHPVFLVLLLSASGAGGGGGGVVHSGLTGSEVARIRLLAVGDINLGRLIGQKILEGDTLYPFALVRDTLRGYDLVFGNLESCLSDQGGETQSPGNNLVFTGPPAGAESLERGGVQVVSTANNHALDYGVAGLQETTANLKRAGVAFVGTAGDGGNCYRPVVLDRGGIRVAIFACTDIMNRPGNRWKQYVASADTANLLPGIRGIRDSVDLIIVSYHGGEEYAGKPSRRAEDFGRSCLDAGATIVLGHHPHVPYGIEAVHGGLLVPSLGNFVFRQPARYWTQRSYALSVTIVRDSLGTRVEGYQVLPLLAGLRPTFVLREDDRDAITRRARAMSLHEDARFVP